MKHCFIPMMLMAAAALASCEKSNLNEQKAQEGSYVYTISAMAPDMVDADAPAQAPTRTDYDAYGNFSWSAGDAISVLFHNGDVNKFFTLTTTESGATAKFSGSIEAGYEIGASDGTVSDKKIWALFPASANHTYTAGSNPSFYVQPSVDFTATHFSANLPMYDNLADEGALSFKHLTGAYKFVIKNVDSSVNKIRLTISNQKTYALSGLWPIDGDPKKLNYDYAEPGSANSCMTLTANVSANQAVFYVPCRRNSGSSFQPIITLYDAETGYTLNKVTASNAKTSPNLGVVQPISISAPGTGNPFWSAYGINWSSESTYVDGDTSANNDAIQLMKVKADTRYVYVYLQINANKLLRDPSYGYANRSYLYLADGTTGSHSNSWNQSDNINYEGWILKNNAYSYTINNTGKGVVGEKPSYIGGLNGTVYMEIAIDRSNANLTFLQNASAETRYVAFYITTAYKVGSGSTTYGTISGYAPAHGGDMLSFSLPGYVAP
jgi:hypothetical protein